MNYIVQSGEIIPGVTYVNTGVASVVYNSITYTSGEQFTGVASFNTFTYSGSGSQIVNEVLQLKGAGLGVQENAVDQPVFPDPTALTGFSVEYYMNEDEDIVPDVTQINGFGIELIDYPFYNFVWAETIT